MLFLVLTIAVCLALHMTAQATYRRDTGKVDHTASGAVTAGDVLQLSDGRAGVALADIADTKVGSLYTEGHFDFASDTATTFTKGEIVWWDDSANLAVNFSGADRTAGDFPVGPALKAKISGDLVVRVDMNASEAQEPGVDMADGGNLVLGATTGTKIGTATSQKLGFWNVTPIIQPAGAAQGAASAQTQDALTDNGGGTADGTVEAVTTFTPSVAWNGSSVYPSAADATAIAAAITAAKNNMKEVTTELAKIRTDIANIKTLEDAIRTALVNTGIMKGAA